MIETKCFEELNVFVGNSPSPDLRLDMPPPEETTGCFPFRRKVSENIFFFLELIVSFHFLG